MSPTTAFLVLMSIHFVADFVLQSDWMATKKSTQFWPLFVHVAIYHACFWVFGWKFAAVTFVCHFIQDAITSRINTRLWLADQRHWFFVAIGFDQLLHTWQLVLTYKWLKL